MDSLDKKSLHLLAGIKQPLTECMNTPRPNIAAPKTPASINITANSGDEVASMLRTLAAMDEKNHHPVHVPGDHIDHSQMINVPRMSDLMSKMDQYEEIKDDAILPYSNSPNEEDVSLGNFPGGLGHDNYSLGRAGDQLTNRTDERMVTPEGLMKEYYNFLKENEITPVNAPNTGNPYKNPGQLPNLTQNMNDVADELKVPSTEVEKAVRSHMMSNSPTRPITRADIKNIYQNSKSITGAQLKEAYINTSKNAIDLLNALINIDPNSGFNGNLANRYVNDVYDVISWIGNNSKYNTATNKEYAAVLDPVIALRAKAKGMEMGEQGANSGKDPAFIQEIKNVLVPLRNWIQKNFGEDSGLIDKQADGIYIASWKDAASVISNLFDIGSNIIPGSREFKGNLANKYARDVYDVISWIGNNSKYNTATNKEYAAVLDPVIALRAKAKGMEMGEQGANSGKDNKFGQEIKQVLGPFLTWINNNKPGTGVREDQKSKSTTRSPTAVTVPVAPAGTFESLLKRIDALNNNI